MYIFAKDNSKDGRVEREREKRKTTNSNGDLPLHTKQELLMRTNWNKDTASLLKNFAERVRFIDIHMTSREREMDALFRFFKDRNKEFCQLPRYLYCLDCCFLWLLNHRSIQKLNVYKIDQSMRDKDFRSLLFITWK